MARDRNCSVDFPRSFDSLARQQSFDVWGFLLFSHAWTWAWWSVPILAGWHVFRFPGVVFLLLGGIGVTIGGVAMTWLVDGRAGLRDLWRRLVEVRRIPSRWYLIVFLLWPALALVGGGLATLANGTSEHVGVETLRASLASPLAFLTSLLLVFLLGPLHEEIGWRGYWLDRLQARSSALTASLVLGVAWAAWHAPLFLMVGYFSSWAFSPEPLPFAFNILVGSVLYTWLYNNANRSVLAAILFHFVGNATGQFLDLSPTADAFQMVVTFLFAVAVVWWWGGDDLRRGANRPAVADGTSQ